MSFHFISNTHTQKQHHVKNTKAKQNRTTTNSDDAHRTVSPALKRGAGAGANRVGFSAPVGGICVARVHIVRRSAILRTKQAALEQDVWLPEHVDIILCPI